jgi:hypothetical protein
MLTKDDKLVWVLTDNKKPKKLITEKMPAKA